MAPAMALRLLVVVAVAAVVSCAVAADEGSVVEVWPMPATASKGGQTLHVSRELRMTAEGSKYADGEAILKDAFQRMVTLIELDHVINGSSQGLPLLAGVNVLVHLPGDEVKPCELVCSPYFLPSCDLYLVDFVLCSSTSGWMNHTICQCLQLEVQFMLKLRLVIKKIYALLTVLST